MLVLSFSSNPIILVRSAVIIPREVPCQALVMSLLIFTTERTSRIYDIVFVEEAMPYWCPVNSEFCLRAVLLSC